MKKLFLLLPIIVFLSGCSQQESESEKYEKLQDRMIQKCFDNGGIPILKSWDNTLKDCKIL